MQINSRAQSNASTIQSSNTANSNVASSVSASSNTGITATVVGLQPSDGKMTLLIGNKQVQVDLQAGLQQGDTVEIRASDGNVLQALVAAVESEGASIDDALQLFSSDTPDLAQVLVKAETILSNPDSSTTQADSSALSLVRTVLPQLTDSTLPSTDQNKMASVLLQQLSNSASQAAQTIGKDLQLLLPMLFPNIATSDTPAKVTQDLLGALATNDFKAAQPLLKQLVQIIDSKDPQKTSVVQPLMTQTRVPSTSTQIAKPSASPSKSNAEPLENPKSNLQAPVTQIATPLQSVKSTSTPFSQKDLQAFVRLLAPLKELSAWGAPNPSTDKTIQKLKTQIQQILSLPVAQQSSAKLTSILTQQPASAQASFIAKVLSIADKSMEVEVAPISNVVATPSTIARQITIELPSQQQWSPQLQQGNTVAFSVTQEPTTKQAQNPNEAPDIAATTREIITDNSNQQFSNQQLNVLPQTDSTYLPPQELADLVKTGAPLTANLVDAHDFLAQYSNEKIPAERVVEFAKVLHSLDLQLPHGESLTSNQKDLALRWLLSTPESQRKATDLQGLVQYQAEADPEKDLFQKLPAPQREWLTQQLTNSDVKAITPKALQNLLEQMPQPSEQATQATPTEHTALTQLKSQVQWTQIDQDTRHPDDRQQVFYFSHAGELQKGRIQFRHESKSRNKQGSGDSTRRFYIETRTANLGKVHVDFRIKGNQVELDFADASGQAKPEVQEERATLAKELDDIGLSLKDISYQLLKPEQALSKASTTSTMTTSGRKSFLDLRA